MSSHVHLDASPFDDRQDCGMVFGIQCRPRLDNTGQSLQVFPTNPDHRASDCASDSLPMTLFPREITRLELSSLGIACRYDGGADGRTIGALFLIENQAVVQSLGLGGGGDFHGLVERVTGFFEESLVG